MVCRQRFGSLGRLGVVRPIPRIRNFSTVEHICSRIRLGSDIYIMYEIVNNKSIGLFFFFF